MLTEQQFNHKWIEIKGGLRNLWGKLSDEELEMVKGNIYEVTSLVESKYGETKTEIRNKIHQLIESFDNDTDKEADPDVSSYHRSPIDLSPDRPNNPRTSADSQNQDNDFGHDFPENQSFADKTYDKAMESLHDPNRHSNYSGANPGREGFGFGQNHQGATLKEKQDFDSDRNARH
jgi:uncharacterized protein YjbJ (UPF0337 family)